MTQHLTQAPATTSHPSLWRSRNFLLLWSGQTVSEVGTRVSGVAVPLLATAVLDASIFQISLLTVLAWLPYLIFSLPAGVLADRVDQRRLMIACDLGRAALLLSVPVVALVGHLTLSFLYVVVGLSGVLTVAFTVAYRSLLPALVPAHDLTSANARLEVSENVAQLAGPSIGGALVGLLGATRTFLADGLSFLASAVTLVLIRHRPGATAPGRVPLRAALTEGLGFIRRQRILALVLACTTTSNFFVMASHAIEVPFLLRTLHASPATIGVLLAVGSVGGLLTGVVAGRLTALIGSARTIWVSMAAPGPLYLLMPLARPGWGALLYGIGMAAFSANAVLFNVAAMSYRQRVTPARLLGRVNAAFLWICYGAIPLGALFGGALGTRLGLRPALLVCVLGMWSAALFVVCSPLRRMRDFTPA
ncbi:MFS transporter [Micromonospora sp. DR5-3]|uniref:MFS transporter n=1 Tax=unclassified Micromonospora TaxID=2617518 RepID=UPI00165277E6|nr:MULTISPECIES: MFS transporter [unclassified Micromonospora]MCW3813345.1 MFS transporter [Micromonospora sp. DR5-3]